ncbi:MAG: hypothetical protein HY718_14040 [Planctomycetes bacterium]|nr:hypothetical protein [Planctomycetota bacterium]
MFLPDDRTPQVARVSFGLGTSPPPDQEPAPAQAAGERLTLDEQALAVLAGLDPKPKADLERISRWYDRVYDAGLGACYEARHAKLALDCAATVGQRRQMQQEGKLKPLADPASQAAADRSYVDTVAKLARGLHAVLDSYVKSDDPHKQRLADLWQSTETAAQR